MLEIKVKGFNLKSFQKVIYNIFKFVKISCISSKY